MYGYFHAVLKLVSILSRSSVAALPCSLQNLNERTGTLDYSRRTDCSQAFRASWRFIVKILQHYGMKLKGLEGQALVNIVGFDVAILPS